MNARPSQYSVDSFTYASRLARDLAQSPSSNGREIVYEAQIVEVWDLYASLQAA